MSNYWGTRSAATVDTGTPVRPALVAAWLVDDTMRRPLLMWGQAVGGPNDPDRSAFLPVGAEGCPLCLCGWHRGDTKPRSSSGDAAGARSLPRPPRAAWGARRSPWRGVVPNG